jgi:5-methylthioadenosine/S-adenosylhomocysteine deaminase
MIFDTLIHNATIVTVNPGFEVIADGVIGIRSGIIEVVGKRSRGPLPKAVEYLDAEGGIALPGLINTHSHLPMSLFRGLADDLPLMTWLTDHIFPAEAGHIAPETIRTGTLLSCAEMLLSGTTCCCDGYFLEDHVAEALNETGMRAVLAQGVIDFPAPGVPDPAKNVSDAVDFIQKWQGRSDRITPSIFCHSAWTCSESTLKRAKKAAQDQGVLFQIHISESRSEQAEILGRHKTTPIRFLEKIGILDENTLLVHCVWVNEKDIELMALRRSRVSVCTESEMKLASGVAPVPAMLAAGLTVGLGADGCASNNNLDMFQEMDMTAKLHKVHSLDPTVMDARSVLEGATIQAARAIGLSEVIGSLEPGKGADLIIVDTNQPHLVPLYHPVSQLVYAARGADVSDVMVQGRFLVRNRKLVTIDIKGICAAAHQTARKISGKTG